MRVAHRLRFVRIDHLLQAHSVADPVLDTEGVEPTLDEPTTVSQGAAREHTSLSPDKLSQLHLYPEKSPQSCMSPEKSPQSCMSPEKSSQLDVPPINCQSTDRCSVNVDILTEFEKRRSHSICEGVNSA